MILCNYGDHYLATKADTFFRAVGEIDNKAYYKTSCHTCAARLPPNWERVSQAEYEAWLLLNVQYILRIYNR